MQEPTLHNGLGPPAAEAGPAQNGGPGDVPGSAENDPARAEYGPTDAGFESTRTLAEGPGDGASEFPVPGQEEAPGSPPAYVCPHCGQGVEATADQAGPFIQCPHCGGQFMAAVETDEDELARQELEAKRKERAHEEEFDAMRVRKLAAGRRAAIRSRSYLIIGAVFCFSCAAGLVYKVVQRVRYERFDVKALGFVLFGLAATMGAVFFARRVMAMTRELELTRLPDPETPPDFSTLSDGSQHWKNLEEVD